MKADRRCAIINFWWSPLDGHGASLTALALYKIIEQMNITKPVLVETAFYSPINEIHNGRHYQFCKRYADVTEESYSSPEDYKGLNYIYEDFVVGSDQVFRPEYVPDRWFLPEIKNRRKVAVAASFGTSELSISKKRQARIANCLKDFDHISLREKDGIETYRKYFGNRENLEWIMDPVFLINNDFFKSLEDKSNRKIDGSFFLFYILDMTPELEKLRNDLERYYGIKAVNDRQDVTAEDFLVLMEKCEFVVTDSYHGMCFSLIYNKPFMGIYNKERGVSRVNTLKDVFGLSKNLITSDQVSVFSNFTLIPEIDYFNVNKTIEMQQKRGCDWIRNALSS